MKDFPVTYDRRASELDASLFKQDDASLIRQLKEKGYEIRHGLTPDYADDISKMCLQSSIKEYCPNDSARRFINQAATQQWLSKGRAAFLLLKREGDVLNLAGYGWSGVEASDHVADSEVTFAIRIGEGSQGQGLAEPFSRLIIAATVLIYEAKNIWLETWLSDGAAVHIYHKIGFVDVDQVEDNRPTADGRNVPDTRLYMSLSNDLL